MAERDAGTTRAGRTAFGARRTSALSEARWFLLAVLVLVGRWSSTRRGLDLPPGRPVRRHRRPGRRSCRGRRRRALAPADRPEPADQVWPETGVKLFAEALPDPCIVLDRRGIVRYANRRAVDAFAIRPGDPLTFRLRVPDLLAAFDRVARGGAPERVEFAERVPTERWFSAWFARLDDGPRSGQFRRPRPPRPYRAEARRPHPGRFRRQCQPRTPHAARLPRRLHRDAAGAGPRGCRGARALPQDHARPGDPDEPADRRSPVAVADRDEGASPAVGRGRPRLDRAARRRRARAAGPRSRACEIEVDLPPKPRSRSPASATS